MQKGIAPFIIMLLVGGIGGYAIATELSPDHHGNDGDEVTMEGKMAMEEDTHMHEGHMHDEDKSHAHGIHDVASVGAPSVALTVHKDPKAGWNIELATENFTFAPESASRDHVAGVGHAHIYVDGEKINRVYGPWYHIGSLEPGEHMIRVTLSTNDHNEYAVDGQVIADEEVVTVQ